MRSRLLCVLAVCFFVACVNDTQTNAHVLITDEHDHVGAVLHITPDDDPIAGKSAHIFYDIQDNLYDIGAYEATLVIEDVTTRKSDEVAMDVQRNYVSGEYTFETQGVYELTLLIRHADRADRFVVTQRVSRGTPANVQAAKARYAWAELLLVVSASGIMTLGIVMLSRGRSVLSQSR